MSVKPRLVLALVVAIAIAATTQIQAPTAEADANSHSVQVIYLVPQGAPRSDRAALMMQATQQVQAQWANWGLTFRLQPDVRVHYSSHDCNHFRGGNEVIDRIADDLGGLRDQNIKYLVFPECSNVRGGAAVSARGHWQMFWEGVIGGIERELTGNESIRSDVGSIGHELGHAFAMPHENCGGGEPGNVGELNRIGLPDYGTVSVMCNGGRWPLFTEDPSLSWISDRLKSQWNSDHPRGCNWFVECSGGNVPSVADTPLTIQPGTIVNEDGLCLDVDQGNRDWNVKIQTWGCNGSTAQLWRTTPAQRSLNQPVEGSLLRSAHSGHCVDVAGGSQNPNAPVVQWGCGSGGYAENRSFDIVNGTIRARHSGQCLASAGHGNSVVQQPCDGSPAQRWTIAGVAPEPTPTPTPIATSTPIPTPTPIVPATQRGDANCDDQVDIVDALVIAQFSTNSRTDAGACPLADSATEINASAGDVDLSGTTDIVDALLIARCVSGLASVACPDA